MLLHRVIARAWEAYRLMWKSLQISTRSLILGSVACIIITISSLYSALKMGALPWPTVFAAIISLCALRVMGKTDSNEVNITHTIMSAGAMVAGGLAFTIPGIWILDANSNINYMQVLTVALSGSILGLVCSAIMRKRFIVSSELEYPLGVSAASVISNGTSGNKAGLKLFLSMGISGLFAFVRDYFMLVPAVLFSSAAIPGVAMGVYASPLMASVGFIVGGLGVLFLTIGSLFGNIALNSALPILDFAGNVSAPAIVANLGMGIMIGGGLAVLVSTVSNRFKSGYNASDNAKPKNNRAVLAGLGTACIALIICMFLDVEPFASVFIVAFSWIACIMACQSVGYSGIDPMEVFGVIAVMILALFSDVSQVQLFFIAGVVSVAAGLTGDLMNDFKAGHILNSNFKGQWVGQVIGSILGCLVAVAGLAVLYQAYGPTSFGVGEFFVSAQANVVATMVSGNVVWPAFTTGLVIGLVIQLLNKPAMMLGLGVYLPIYLCAAIIVGGIIKFVFNAFVKNRQDKEGLENDSTVIASGILGGESIAGVVIALMMLASEVAV